MILLLGERAYPMVQSRVDDDEEDSLFFSFLFLG